MASSPNSSKRLISKGSSNRRQRGQSAKQRSEKAGSFAQHARRDRMVGEVPLRKGAEKKLDPARRLYGGELVISGDMDDRLRREIMNMVRNTVTGRTGRTAKAAEVRTEKDRIVVRTAEGQPAIALGKRLHRAHKGGRLKITWTDDASPVRVHWTTGE
jgi:hypothetical protein